MFFAYLAVWIAEVCLLSKDIGCIVVPGEAEEIMAHIIL